jgi:hypothetical protein
MKYITYDGSNMFKLITFDTEAHYYVGSIVVCRHFMVNRQWDILVYDINQNCLRTNEQYAKQR